MCGKKAGKIILISSSTSELLNSRIPDTLIPVILWYFKMCVQTKLYEAFFSFSSNEIQIPKQNRRTPGWNGHQRSSGPKFLGKSTV